MERYSGKRVARVRARPPLKSGQGRLRVTCDRFSEVGVPFGVSFTPRASPGEEGQRHPSSHPAGFVTHNPGSDVIVTLIVPVASVITRSVLESKAMSARSSLVMFAVTRTPSSFF
jgi:hypothetical protein